MKTFVNAATAIAVLCGLVLNSTLSFGAEKTRRVERPAVELKPIKSEVLTADVLAKKFVSLNKVDKQIRALNTHLTKQGFAAQTGPKNFWGVTETYQDKAKGTTVDFAVHLQDYAKPGSKDAAAVAQVVVTAGKESQTYSFYLLAPGGNFDKATEYAIGRDLKIAPATSWWSCVKAYMRKHCVSTCLESLVTCPKTSWAAYLGCVAVKCGGCFIKGSLCCACDCSWWCKWAVGCCDR